MLLALAGRLVQFAVMFLTIKFMTTYLRPEEFGKVAIITATTSFFAMFLVNPVGTYINRHLHQWRLERTIRSALVIYARYLLIVSLFAFLFLQVIYLLPITLLENWWVIASLVPLTLLIGTANQTLIPSLNHLGLIKEFTYLNVFSAVIALCIAVALVNFGNPTAVFWLFGILIGQGLAALLAAAIYYRHPALLLGVNKSILHLEKSEILAFALPVSLTAGFIWLNFQGYRLALTGFITVEQLGIFAASYGLATQMAAAAELILNTWFQPKFYQHCDSPQAEIREAAWSVYALQISIPMVFIVAGGIVFAPLFVKHMLGPAYQNTVHIYQMGLAIELIRVLIGTSNLFFHQRKITKQLIAPNASGAFIGVVAMCLLVWQYGDILILPALGLGAMITLSWILFLIGRIHPLDINLPKRFFLALFASMLLVALIECPAKYSIDHYLP